ncbi:MAG TPA: winged helix-turn-helix domain-containing protein [Baekduia sp.]|nr:winged helix-turn-helix domain-containing protein [Baekduia sp.]
MLDPDFLSAIGHPVRFQALVLFERTPSSARELADLVGLSPSAVLYHVSKLEEAGLIEAAGTRRRRAFDERVWRTRSTGWADLERLLAGAAGGSADPP